MSELRNPETARLIERGECPGWDSYSDGYVTEETAYRGAFRPRRCSRRATRGDLCGTHDNIRKSCQARRERAEGRREANRQAERAHSLALNLAMMLTDKLGVGFSASGPHVTLDAESARLLLDRSE